MVLSNNQVLRLVYTCTTFTNDCLHLKLFFWYRDFLIGTLRLGNWNFLSVKIELKIASVAPNET